MTLARLQAICSKYDVLLSDEHQLALLQQIIDLPTSDIIRLFNDLQIEKTFHDTKEKEHLF